MACPRCGGTNRTLIAPGVYECTTVHVIQMRGPGFGAPPTGQFGPQFVSGTAVCGMTYQEGPSAQPGAPVCRCGTYAVGVCAQCGAHVCGRCSIVITDQRICVEHERLRQQQAAELATAAKRAADELEAHGKRRAEQERDAQFLRMRQLAQLLKRHGSPEALRFRPQKGHFGPEQPTGPWARIHAWPVAKLQRWSAAGSPGYGNQDSSLQNITVHLLSDGRFGGINGLGRMLPMEDQEMRALLSNKGFDDEGAHLRTIIAFLEAICARHGIPNGFHV